MRRPSRRLRDPLTHSYRKLQVSTTTTVNGFPFVDITNAPKATIYGVEGNFEVTPVENLTIRGSGTYLHARHGSGFLFGGVGVSNVPIPGLGGGVGINANADPLKTCLNVSQIRTSRICRCRGHRRSPAPSVGST